MEEEAIYVRCILNGEPVTKFVTVENPLTVDAAGITDALKKGISSLKLCPDETSESFLDNFYKRLVNVNFDGASVMSGHVSGVQKRFKDVQPGLIYTHCVAHRLELAVLDAIKSDDNYLEKFDAIVNDVFKFYYYSALRRKELKTIAEYLEDEFKQLGLMKNIRWLASRSRALNILETNYKTLVFDMESKSYGQSETSKKARGYVEFIKRPHFLFYLHFLQDLVAILRDVSLVFQKDDLLVFEIPAIIETACCKLDSLSMVKGVSSQRLMNQLSELNGDLVYKETNISKLSGRRAVEVEHTIAGYDEYFTKHFDNIIEATKIYLKMRFSDFEKEPLLSVVKVFDYHNWPKSFNDDKRWGLQEIEIITNYFVKYQYLDETEKNRALRHWPVYRARIIKQRHEKLYEVLTNTLKENDPDMQGMNTVLELVMTFSSSTAACERGFSTMNRNKTKLRMKMTNETLNDVMRICIDGNKLEDFNPEIHYKKWIEMAKRTRRHISGHKSWHK